ncbi:hypothetical protein Y032_0482g2279 [Ancylostoma ceylanicum]|uniref:Uncharacterized protein n=1 Tax=Ancylostoma ceylanicum TaxID=53326 RepID=A0A016WXI4_9BILA|nr:hypothetical protein Y032_0482g2279 [Ancylostoma ceylanicum]
MLLIICCTLGSSYNDKKEESHSLVTGIHFCCSYPDFWWKSRPLLVPSSQQYCFRAPLLCFSILWCCSSERTMVYVGIAKSSSLCYL